MMGSHLCLPKCQDSEGGKEKTMEEALPESLVSGILSRTSPRDACRFSAVSRGFKLVADSDSVWDRFLPSDHRKIISRSVYPVAVSTKKQLYFILADGFILLDGGKLSFSLDKASGKKCFMLGARELAIECGRYPVNWTWRYLPQSRFVKKKLNYYVFASRRVNLYLLPYWHGLATCKKLVLVLLV